MVAGEVRELEFWILDASYDVVKGHPVIYLWGITESGERIVVAEKNFRPYFYLVPENAISDALVERVRTALHTFKVLSVNAIERKLFGRTLNVLKVTITDPRDVPKAREVAAKIPGIRDVLEADIRFYMRYMVDTGISPSSWVLAKVRSAPVPNGWRVDEFFELVEAPRSLDKKSTPRLKTYAFDIECYNRYGEPDPERDPVLVISRTGEDGTVIFSQDEGSSEKKLLEEFVNDLVQYDPDVILGYNSNRFDWPYLLQRARVNGVKLSIGRNLGEPSQSVYGHFSVVGRANVDLYDYASELQEVKVKTLENVSEFLGVMKKSERVLIDTNKVYEYWDSKDKRSLLLRYAGDDARSTYLLGQVVLPFGIQLSSLVGLPLDQVFAASVGNRVEWFLIRQAFVFNELVPNSRERGEETYKGAIVLKPKPGVHKKIAVLDFSSMYPNIMIKYNISPDTYVPPEEHVDPSEVWVAPEVGHRFRKHPPGFYRKVLESLLEARRRLREKMKTLDPRSEEYRIYDERQKAIKVITNATYGYSGWSMARWYKREVAEATTAWGRELIKATIKKAQSLGLSIIYGDTDSIFVQFDEEKIGRLVEYVEKELGFEIKLDKVYEKVFFTESKKKYCGLLADGRVDLVGFEAVRGDWAEISKEIQERVVEIVLKEEDPWKAVDFVRKTITELSEGRIPLEKLVIWKTLSKDLDEYEVDAPHVVVARELKRLGYRVGKGAKIGYIVVKGAGKVSEKAKPLISVKSPDEVDTDYYVKRQIVPAALRILEYFGVKEEHFSTGRRQATLSDFF
ncbi:DNA-directed DNA polymerase [Thermofilum pendens]|uniref:DNA polymerase n=1 Tax=Thermofilum pendens (strain DSM 2475 / Hrk 5) TaxID=368408 RepID=A1RX72_THEPD|nr:DNA polymerase II [Thermofilum pendens]ABL77802.1 replicative DNA polymerase I [Thermofilum pendens Hrk 5]